MSSNFSVKFDLEQSPMKVARASLSSHVTRIQILRCGTYMFESLQSRRVKVKICNYFRQQKWAAMPGWTGELQYIRFFVVL
jgi:hypothetical protein